MVTIELAVGILLVFTVTACMVSVSSLGVAQAACEELAAQLARQTARADTAAVAEAESRAAKGAKMEVVRGPEGVESTVRLDVQIFGLGTVQVIGEAWAAYEPGARP